MLDLLVCNQAQAGLIGCKIAGAPCQFEILTGRVVIGTRFVCYRALRSSNTLGKDDRLQLSSFPDHIDLKNPVVCQLCTKHGSTWSLGLDNGRDDDTAAICGIGYNVVRNGRARWLGCLRTYRPRFAPH
jgi:hypothetical protein